MGQLQRAVHGERTWLAVGWSPLLDCVAGVLASDSSTLISARKSGSSCSSFFLAFSLASLLSFLAISIIYTIIRLEMIFSSSFFAILRSFLSSSYIAPSSSLLV